MSQYYRRLLRSVQKAFQGDQFAMKQARNQLHQEFTKNKGISDPAALVELQQNIEEIDEMLRFHIVQGKLNERGNYEVRWYR
jgi:hypothetical protein